MIGEKKKAFAVKILWRESAKGYSIGFHAYIIFFNYIKYWRELLWIKLN